MCLVVAALLLAPGALGFGIRARVGGITDRTGAITDRVRERIPFADFPVPNYCTGEMIYETGAITTWFKYTATTSGGTTVQYHYQFKAIGAGDLGNRYVINQEARTKYIANPRAGADYTFVDKFVQISNGSEDNTFFFFTFRLVVQPDGMVRMTVLDVKFDCRG
jgi:hypothetical protein